jgi:hypothetical protein
LRITESTVGKQIYLRNERGRGTYSHLLCSLVAHLLVGMCTKKTEPFDPAFSFLLIKYDLFLKELLPPISHQSNQTRAKKERGRGFGDRLGSST